MLGVIFLNKLQYKQILIEIINKYFQQENQYFNVFNKYQTVLNHQYQQHQAKNYPNYIRQQMNTIFIKNLNPHSHHQEEQSDFDRLIELCNSYGLNQEETQQLIDEFKKGSYQSNSNSINQSIFSDQHKLSKNQLDCSNQHFDNHCEQLGLQNLKRQNQKKNQTRSILDQNSRVSNQKLNIFNQKKYLLNEKQKNQNQHSADLPYYYYQQRDTFNEDQSPNRYSRFQNVQRQQQSYSQMTFNEIDGHLLYETRHIDRQKQNNQPQIISQQKIALSSQSSQNIEQKNIIEQQKIILQKVIQQQKIINQNISPNQFHQQEKKILRNNSHKETSLPNNPSTYPQNFQQNNPTFNNLVENKKSRESLSTKSVSQQQNSKNLEFDSQKQNSVQQIQEEQQRSQNYINHEYILQLIRNFEILEKQNQILKEQNSKLGQKISQLGRQNKVLVKQNLTLKNSVEVIQKQNLTYKTKLETLLQCQKQKSQMLIQMKQKDSEIIKDLKNSIVGLTQLVKQKDVQNIEFQNKLFLLSQKIQNQSLLFKQQSLTVPSSCSYGRSASRKSFTNVKNDNQKLKKIQQQKTSTSKREPAQITSVNANLSQNQQIPLPSKAANREPWSSKILANEQLNMKKQTQGNKPKDCKQEAKEKENVFNPVQVELSFKRVQSNIIQQEEIKRRPQSRVDIKKYKGMIEQLRNNYSNMTGSNNLLR